MSFIEERKQPQEHDGDIPSTSAAMAPFLVELEAERRTLRRMEKSAKVLATLVVAGLVIGIPLVIALGVERGDLLGAFQYLLGSVRGILFSLLVTIWVPSGIMGMWRAIRRSSLFVWGGWIVMFLIWVLTLIVAFTCGLPFYLFQRSRVRKLEDALAAADGAA